MILKNKITGEEIPYDEKNTFYSEEFWYLIEGELTDEDYVQQDLENKLEISDEKE